MRLDKYLILNVLNLDENENYERKRVATWNVSCIREIGTADPIWGFCKKGFQFTNEGGVISSFVDADINEVVKYINKPYFECAVIKGLGEKQNLNRMFIYDDIIEIFESDNNESVISLKHPVIDSDGDITGEHVVKESFDKLVARYDNWIKENSK